MDRSKQIEATQSVDAERAAIRSLAWLRHMGVIYGFQFPSADPSGLANTTVYPSGSRSQISQ